MCFSTNDTPKTPFRSMDENHPLKNLYFLLTVVDPDPSNTWMLGPTPITTQNGSSITPRTFTQLRNKNPIGYNGTPHVHSQNCPFCGRSPPPSICLNLGPADPPLQTASKSNQPFFPNFTGQTDQQTDRHRPTDKWDRRYHVYQYPLICSIDHSDAANNGQEVRRMMILIA